MLFFTACAMHIPTEHPPFGLPLSARGKHCHLSRARRATPRLWPRLRLKLRLMICLRQIGALASLALTCLRRSRRSKIGSSPLTASYASPTEPSISPVKRNHKHISFQIAQAQSNRARKRPPTGYTCPINTGALCNGSTAVSKTARLGSTPSAPAIGKTIGKER